MRPTPISLSVPTRSKNVSEAALTDLAYESHTNNRIPHGLTGDPGVREAVLELNDARQGRLPALTVIVPTRNEAANVPLLLDRLGAAVVGIGAEVLVVDDSDDD